MAEPILHSTRAAAIAAGEKFYFTGEPCIHGHLEKRWASSKRCYRCDILGQRARYKKNPEAAVKRVAEYYRKNREKVTARQKKFRGENRERLIREWHARYAHRNPERRKMMMRKWREKNKERLKREWHTRYAHRNVERRKKLHQEWIRNNPDKVRAATKRSHAKWKNDPKNLPSYLAKTVLRNFLYRMRMKKTDRTHKMLGYSSEELAAHLEAHMEPWMSWANYGTRWSIDHTIPVAEFRRQGITDARVINALSNLRPMCKTENIRKRDHFPDWLRPAIRSLAEPVASSTPSH